MGGQSLQLLPFLVTGVAMTNPIELPARPRGQKMGSGRINGKYLELLMHSDEAMDAYGRACAEAAVAAQAAELEALRADAERWRQFRDGDCSVPAGPDYPAHDLVMARLNNATENYVREGSGVADYDAAVDACAARAALKEQTPNVGAKLETTAPARN